MKAMMMSSNHDASVKLNVDTAKAKNKSQKGLFQI